MKWFWLILILIFLSGLISLILRFNPIPTNQPLLPTTTPAQVHIQTSSINKAIYKGGWFGSCAEWEIIYQKTNSTYNKTTTCNIPGRAIPTPPPKIESITQTDFEDFVYALGLDNQPQLFSPISLAQLEAGFNPHPQTHQCWRSQDQTTTICKNSQGVVVDRYIDLSIKGIADGNRRYQLKRSE